jgi:mercuric ion binding protein
MNEELTIGRLAKAAGVPRSRLPQALSGARGKVPGVAATKIDLAKMTATVKFDPDRANVAALVEATTNAGYPSSAHN